MFAKEFIEVDITDDIRIVQVADEKETVSCYGSIEEMIAEVDRNKAFHIIQKYENKHMEYGYRMGLKAALHLLGACKSST